MIFRSKLVVIEENLKGARLLIEKGFNLQAFFLMLPIFEVVGKCINRNLNNSESKFVIGFFEVFKMSINLDTKIQILKIYTTVRCALFHNLEISEARKKISNDSELFANENIIPQKHQTDYDNCNVFLNAETGSFSKNSIKLGALDTLHKIKSYFSDDAIKNNEWYQIASFSSEESNPAASGMANATIVNVNLKA